METEKPVEKLNRRGAEALTDSELVSVILSVPMSRAESIVKDSAVSETSRAGALAEYRKRGRSHDPRPIIDGARAAAGMVPPEIRTAQKEHFLVLVLNARRQLVKMETVSVGTLSASLVHPREVFSAAIKAGGAAVVCIHNHPSGDTSPSAEDREATRRLQRAGELLGIPLADHVIVSESSFFSFRESGLL